MKKSFSVMVAIVLIASMSVFAFAACVTDDECRHSAMQCIDAVDATCIENGNVEFWYCPDCGKYYSDEMGEHAISIDDTVIAATGEHDWGAWVTDSESSCTTGGTRHRVCNVCGERQDETLPVGEHDLNFVKAVEATCTKEGNVAYWHCSECGKNFADELGEQNIDDIVIPAKEHSYADEWSCSSLGHFHVATCEHKDLYSDFAVHIYDKNNVCKVCGYHAIDTEGLAYEYDLMTDSYIVVGKGTATETDIVIPRAYEGKPVTSIGEDAFRNRSSLTSVVIPDNVTSIGDYAFYGCRGLTSITIPDSVISIGYQAFYTCSGLTSIEVEEGNPVYHSDGNCLIETGSKTLIVGCKTSVIPDDSSVTSIGSSAFEDCSGLTSVTIPDSVTSIGYHAFYNCSGLTSVTIPDSVTSIGYAAFDGCSGLTSVTIGNSVISIGDRAFSWCSGLTSITIPDSVISIGESAFSGCSGLTSVTIPDSVTSIGRSAFNCNDLTDVYYQGDLSGWLGLEFYDYDVNPMYYADNLYINGELLQGDVVIPDGTEKIGDYAFYNCSGLTSIIIPDSVTSIGRSAFNGCSGLTSVTIPDSVTSIGNSAFSRCSGLTSIVIPDSVTSIGGGAFYDCDGVIEIENGISYVDDWIVDCDTSLVTDIMLRETVRGIANSAFSDCTISNYNEYGNALYLGNADNPYIILMDVKSTDITSCTVNKLTKLVNKSAFRSCDNLSRIIVEEGNTFYRSSGNCLIETKSKTLIAGSSTSVIPDDGSVTSIGDYAFYECDGLKSITIPDSVTSIGDYAFYRCYGLTSVTIGNGVTSIGDYAFYGCGYLRSVTIPDGVTNIGVRAFYNCNDLTSITISDSVTSIGAEAFHDCIDLTDVYYQGDLSGWLEIEFGGYSANPMRYADNLYIADMPEDGVVVIEDGITEIRDYELKGLKELKGITIPDSVTSIGYCAFYRCSGLTSIVLPDSVISIGESAFYRCSGLTSIVLPDSVISIGERAFSGCSGLTSVVMPDSVTSIGYGAFSGCSGLTSITIPDSVTSIGIDAFSGCSGLTSIEVEEGNPFYHSSGNCLIETTSKTLISGCKASVIPDDGSVTSISEGAFSGCSGLTSIVLPDSVISIGESAFSGCSSLTSIVLPGSVISIGESAFFGCSSLTSITIPDGVTSIGDGTFSGCSSLTSIVIPDSVTSIGEYAFNNCSALTDVYYQGDLKGWLEIDFVNFYARDLQYYADNLYINGELLQGELVIPDSVTSIGDYAFYECSGLTSIVIPDSVTSIGHKAFSGCSGLTSVVIPDSVTSIDGLAFQYCSGLTTINFQGTMAQWQAIDKWNSWDDDTGEFTVICTDGTISKANA